MTKADQKKYRVFTSLTKRMCDWLEKNRPNHMSRSVAIEHYFWLGIEYEKLQNNNVQSTRY